MFHIILDIQTFSKDYTLNSKQIVNVKEKEKEKEKKRIKYYPLCAYHKLLTFRSKIFHFDEQNSKIKIKIKKKTYQLINKYRNISLRNLRRLGRLHDAADSGN